MRVDASELKAKIGEIEYHWEGGFGSVIASYERGVKQNEVRMIGDVIFYACRVYSGFLKSRVCWSPQQKIDADWLRSFKAAIFT